MLNIYFIPVAIDFNAWKNWGITTISTFTALLVTVMIKSLPAHWCPGTRSVSAVNSSSAVEEGVTEGDVSDVNAAQSRLKPGRAAGGKASPKWTESRPACIVP